MYFSFIYTSDLIIWLLEMFHVLSSCIANMKNIKGNILSKGSVSSKYRVGPESKRSNVNDILN